MQSGYLLWLASAFYAWHVVEEFVYDLKTGATKMLHLPTSWTAFYITNVSLLVLGIYCLSIGWKLPDLSLIYLVSMLTNVILIQMIPAIVRRRFSSRLIRPNSEQVLLFGVSLRIDTLILLRRIGALVLFLPAATGIYSSAARGGTMVFPALVIFIISAIVVIAYPISLLRAFVHRSKEVGYENPGN